MNYQHLYLFLMIIGLALIFCGAFKIRKLLIENSTLKMKLACSRSDNKVLKLELQRIKSTS